MAKFKITDRDQRIAADILMYFMFVRNMEDVRNAFAEVYKNYDLFDDPFTHMPCSAVEYSKYSAEYAKQTMIERYGHCDGLE